MSLYQLNPHKMEFPCKDCCVIGKATANRVLLERVGSSDYFRTFCFNLDDLRGLAVHVKDRETFELRVHFKETVYTISFTDEKQLNRGYETVEYLIDRAFSMKHELDHIQYMKVKHPHAGANASESESESG